MIRQLYAVIEKSILIVKAFEKFNEIFQKFPLFSKWNRIQFSIMHMRFWSMSKCVKTFIIISLLLHCWLKTEHIRKSYEAELLREFSLRKRNYTMTFVDVIISCFVKLTKSNVLISSFQLSVENRNDFHNQILNARRSVLKFMNVVNKNFRFRSDRSINDMNKNVNSAAFAASCDETDQSMISTQLRLFIETTKKNEVEKHFNILSNFHIAVHFATMMKKYGVLWNANVLFEENKHRFFKQTVLSINHRKSERQLLLKNAMRFTMKTILSEAFSNIYSRLISQFARIQKHCFNVLKTFDDFICNESECEKATKMTNISLKFIVRSKLKINHIQKLKFFNRLTNVSLSEFCNMMKKALNSYELHVINWSNRFLYWYEECTFVHQSTEKKYTIHVNDFLHMACESLIQICHIYMHIFDVSSYRRVFIWVRYLQRFSYQNEVLQLQFYRLINHQEIVAISTLSNDKAYLISIFRDLNDMTFFEQQINIDLLHCDWKINFLWITFCKQFISCE